MSVFSDDAIIKKLQDNFVNVATDINYVQHQQDAEGEFFRKIAEQGHYAGRTKPTSTRQGLYIATSEGKLLASVNTTSAERVMMMIDEALKGWDKINPATIEKFKSDNQPDKRFNVGFPEGGMILRETMRDLPRNDDTDHEIWRHNFDHVWLTGDEVKSFVPADTTIGFKYEIPTELARRVAAYHFVDQVKGEADAWSRSEVQQASLAAEVISNLSGEIQIRLSGSAKCVKPPTGEVNPFSRNKITEERGVDLKIHGWLSYNADSKSFSRFDVLATGDRWGAATYNFRSRDLGPEPIGFAFELLPTRMENKTRPKFLLWNYFD